MNEKITFENLPHAVADLTAEVRIIKQLLSEQSSNCLPRREHFLTVTEAAKYLNLAIPTIYGLCHRRQIPYMKRSKRIYFSQEKLREYLEAGRRQTEDEIRTDAAHSLHHR